jgi:hypothetical protein
MRSGVIDDDVLGLIASGFALWKFRFEIDGKLLSVPLLFFLLADARIV